MTDIAMIAQTATTLLSHGTVAEIRVLNTPRGGTVSGYFDDLQAFIRAARQWSGKAPAVYATLNPCNPALLARAANRLKERVRTTTSDSDIVHRSWLPLDFDPVRPADISATEAEHDAALHRAEACAAWLTQHGWPAPVAADSGNGGHRLYAIDLPNDEASTALLQRGLEALAMYFSDSEVKLDVGVFNAGRIWKVYGTMACKGDNLPERPHRLARLLDVPAPVEVVTRAQLEALAALVPAPPQTPSRSGPQGREAFELDRWIADHGLPVVSRGAWGSGGARWILNPCPWNSAHTNKSAFIVQFASGAIAAGCHHNGCQENDWHALRRLYEPGWTPYRDRPQSAPASKNGSHAGVGAEGLSSLSSLSSQPGENGENGVFASEEELNSLFSLNSQVTVILREEAFHGLAGELVRLISPHTEANEAALLIQFLTYFGALVGRQPYYVVGATKHYPNLFAVLVGPTGKARKGTAYDHIKALMKSVDTSWSDAHVIGGCGSGEGIINAVRDPITKREPIKVKGKITGYEDILSDPGIIDKRLLIYEPEFASVLKVVSREGNILSMTLRQAWDSDRLQNTVKTSPQKATNAHVALLGHITADELKTLLTTTEAANGFGNRFLWMGVKRTKLLPDGGGLEDINMQEIRTKLRHAHQASKGITRMWRDAEATRAWRALYKPLSEDQPGLAGALLARSEPHVLRVSMLYALLDASAVIRPEHLYAALAVWEYAEASVHSIFGTTSGNQDADTLRDALRWAEAGRMTKTEIISEVFHGHIKAHNLNAAIRTLAQEGLVTRQFAPSTGGRRKEYICYGSSSNNSILTRARTGYIELARLALTSVSSGETKTCELSELSELSPSPPVTTPHSPKMSDCEESEESELSPSPPVTTWNDRVVQAGDWCFVLSVDGVQQNAEPYFIASIENGSDGQQYARFYETDTGWPLAQCVRADPPELIDESDAAGDLLA